MENKENPPETLETSNNCIIQGDCIDFMRNCSPLLFDCILTDPPYDIEFQNKLKILIEARNYKEYQYNEFDNPDYSKFAKLFSKVLKNDSYCIIFASDGQIAPWTNAMEQQGFNFIQILIWQKESAVFALSPYRTAITHEPIIIYRKGSPMKLDNSLKGRGSIFKFNKVKNRYHPAQKPIGLLTRIIKLYTKKNDLIFDPFAGSGSTIKSAIKNNRKGIGCELIEEYVEKSNKEIKQIKPEKDDIQKILK